MAWPILLSFSLFVTTWISWRIFTRLFSRTVLSNIAGPQSDSWITGNLLTIMDPNTGWKYNDWLIKTYGSTFQFTGLLGEKFMYTYDPKAVYHIFVKGYPHTWDETEEFLRTNKPVFGKGIVSTTGSAHEKQRKLLVPTFSTATIRELTPIVYNVVHKLRESLTQEVGQGEKEIDLSRWMTRTALEIIGQSGFGHSFDSLKPDSEEHPFSRSVKNLFPVMSDPGIMAARNLLLPWLHNIGSPRLQRAAINLLPWKKLHELRDIIDIMHNTAVEILERTKKSLANGDALLDHIGQGKDILSVLVKANMDAASDEKLPEDQLLSEISTLIFAGMDTTSNALARCLHLLCVHQDTQGRLRDEVTNAWAEQNGDPDYDTLITLPYLDAVCRETLRLFPPLPFLIREAKQDAVLPLSIPITTVDGRGIESVFTPAGTKVLVAVHRLNCDPTIWGPDGTEWRPERWLSPLLESVAKARVPGVFSNNMTFSAGGRSCLGLKFSQLEMKVVLAILVRNFKLSPSEKDIIWQLTPIVTPTTADAKCSPTGTKEIQLPIRVSLVT